MCTSCSMPERCAGLYGPDWDTHSFSGSPHISVLLYPSKKKSQFSSSSQKKISVLLHQPLKKVLHLNIPLCKRSGAGDAPRLQGGVWCMHITATDQLHHKLIEPRVVLVNKNIYMVAYDAGLIILDLAASSFSRIQFPQGV